KETLSVPDPEEDIPELDTEVIDDEPAPTKSGKSKSSAKSDEGFSEKPQAKPQTSYDLSDDEDEERRRRRRRRDDADDEIDRSRRRSRKDRPERQDESSTYQGGFLGAAFNGGILAGLAAMIIAVVWFVLALVYADRIYFYPPILFIVGLGGVIRGIFNGE
ncbi:MAG: hypothetical protein HYR84_08110, partial [Planctomycetes bacterium]|nr:hypothetical protein [Planctomycetota bacterium]